MSGRDTERTRTEWQAEVDTVLGAAYAYEIESLGPPP